jgi:hypothetical protein
MERNIRVRGIKRKQIDEDKLALAFLLLAKILHEQDEAGTPTTPVVQDRPTNHADDASEAA